MCHYLVDHHKDDIPHWRDLLLQDGVTTPSQLCGVSDIKILPTMGCKGLSIFELIKQCNCPSCKCLFEDVYFCTTYRSVFSSTATASADTYTRLASIQTFRELEKLPPDQQQKLITQVLRESLPTAKDDLLIDEIRPLLYQNGVITSEEATELLGVFTGEEKITRLYTEMLPNKGLQGLDQYMRILFDTGWETPSHMRHHGVLSINLSVSELTNE